MSIYRLSELLDLTIVQKMADAHYRAAGMPTGIIDAIDGSILVGSGWQDICVKFHRANPVSLKRCQESDSYIKDRLVEGEACRYKCQNGLWDIGMPIVVAGYHLATMFLGQFFYEGEVPDREFFIRQAHELGFDIDEYLAALDRVPVFSHEKVHFILEYDKALVSFIADLAKYSLLKITADERTRENERKFHAIFDQSFQFLWLLSTNGKLLGANRTALKFCGVEEAHVIGRSFWETSWWVHSPAAQEKVRLAVQKAAKGELVRFEATLRTADDSLRHVDFSLKPVTDETGEVVLLMPEGRDITERKHAEEELRRTNRFLDSIVENIPNMIFLKDAREFRFVRFNRAGEDLLGNSRDDLIGKNDHDFFPKQQADFFTQKDREVLRGKEIVDIPEEPIQTRYKGERILHTKKVPILDANGEPEYLLGISEDITDLKHAETEKEKLRSQLLQSQKMEAIGTLAGGIAHDFNNILTTIIGYSSLLQMDMDEDDKGRLYADQILASSQKAANLTQGLLAFSRKQAIELKPHDVNSIINGVTKLLKRLLTEDIDFKVTLADQQIVILCDVSRFDQVLINLAANARDAMPGGGRLGITAKEVLLDDNFIRAHGFGTPGSYALISVTDTGCGMDERTREKIFEPFFTTKEVGKGTGLGLSIVYGIVKQHNGYVNVYSEPQKGTTFNIYIPTTREAALEATKAAVEVKGGTETILVAEDNYGLRKLMEEVLTRKGYTVVEAKDGEDALWRFMENQDKIDLLILDVVMPRKNGKEVYEEIRKVKPGVKVLFTSGYTGDILFDKGVKDELYDFIPKPILPNELLIKIRDLIDK
ncbi:MAG TPA: PocR ligand-binding domain-containing protein [Syntrophorhabdaceae bacterium]|nr:PocR ligand-binding domain-containing protein [Syntrophorhabdaceae bacterium]